MDVKETNPLFDVVKVIELNTIDEVERRIKEKLKVFVRQSIVDKIFEGHLPLNRYPSFSSLIWYHKEKCYLFENINQVKLFDSYLSKINESLECFDKGWRIKSKKSI